ncbi:hypothetical protein [Owenweeksia hongkongensis]|uniref:hypothetical protein n=1 Tax=Owenweeksia hongkongensis TaxID=253245 RepID=UPI003A94EDC7
MRSIARNMLGDYFPEMNHLKSGDKDNPYTQLIEWFGRGNSIDFLTDFTDKEYQDILNSITPLPKLVGKYQEKANDEEKYFLMEMVLWALAEYSKLNKERLVSGYNFSDLFSSYLRDGELDIDLN